MLITSILRVILTRSFKPFSFEGAFESHLDYADLKNLGLYVHIPFCHSICSFCPYCKVLYDRDLAAKYKEALLSEIKLVGNMNDGKKCVTSLYFGGGTPVLMLDDLKEIIDVIKEYFIIKGGIGVELHPDDINEAVLDVLKSAGVTMVSVGIQSFNYNCLSVLGRKYRDFTGEMDIVRAAEFDVVDVDLIFAIPWQTSESLKNDIENAFSHGATQVSTYPFIDFTFADNKYKPMSEKSKKYLLAQITEFARESGKQRTSVWTYSQKGTSKYSSVTRDNFLGFGVSATTLLQDQFKINTFSIDAYIDRITNDILPTSLTLHFSQRQRACYYLFWNCYSMQIDPKVFEKMIGKPLAKMYGFELWVGELFGLLNFEGDVYKLTDKGAYYYHYIEQVYTMKYIDKMWNISRKQAFPKKITLK
ncbi:coproporphyrinogen III oxidase [Clostridia bacterium]|nr:coproporphyrinogen III oxidase [Clostridia bacterium]